MAHSIRIGKRLIGTGFPVYIVAELSANHNKDFNQAVKLIHAAKDAGVDAVKVQTYTADTLTLQSDKEFFAIKEGSPWSGRTLYDLYNETNMPWEWQPKLKTIANELGLDFFSTGFDFSSVDFLERMDVPVHKIASFEIVDIPLIEKMGWTKKPLIISTGMASIQEIKEAVSVAKEAGAQQIALLKCTSAYPADFKDMNLRSIPQLAKKFRVPIGLSDHTLNPIVAVTAVALGACIIEKHLTLSRQIPGPDSGFSLEPSELKELVMSIRIVEGSLGSKKCCFRDCEKSSLAFRRSLFIVKDMKVGDQFSPDNVRSIRPTYGLPPKYLKDCLGKRASRDIEKGTPLSWDLVS
jgi:pseudaminic acid synthase